MTGALWEGGRVEPSGRVGDRVLGAERDGGEGGCGGGGQA